MSYCSPINFPRRIPALSNLSIQAFFAKKKINIAQKIPANIREASERLRKQEESKRKEIEQRQKEISDLLHPDSDLRKQIEELENKIIKSKRKRPKINLKFHQ